MLNNSKIKLMTKLAIYEEGKGKEAIKIHGHFRSDYLGRNMLKTAFAVTIAYGIFLMLWVIYNFEEMIADIYKVNVEALVIKGVGIYLGLLIVYELITYLRFSIKYMKAEDSIKRYKKRLKKMEQFYKKESE
jgi:hypothetical protein